MNAPERAASLEAPGVAAERLLGIVRGMLAELRAGEVRPLHLDDRIAADLGIDSLSRVELTARVEAGFGVRLPERAALEARTLRDLLRALERAERTGAMIPAAPVGQIALPTAVEGLPDATDDLVEAFRWHLERHPDREHITLVEADAPVETLSYARLWADAGETARGLAAIGLARGDAVALMLPTSIDFFRVFLGAWLLGAVPVPLYPPTRWSQIAEHVRGRAAILANCEARVLVTVAEALALGRLVRAGLPALASVTTVPRLRESGEAHGAAAGALHEIALLQYTSGSTGDPKGVVLTHANLLANIRVMGRAAGAGSTDRFVSWLPLYHDMGLIGAWLATMYHAVPLVVMPPTAFLGRPSRWLWTVHRYRATISAGPNFAYEIAASKIRDEDLTGLDLSSWRLAFNGAEPVRAATLARFAQRFARYGFDARALTPVYGLAEAALGLTFPPLMRGPRVDRIDARALAVEGRALPGDASSASALEVVSAGAPLRGCELRVVDAAGREVPERVEGRIEFRAPSATTGYYRNPDATAKLFRQGWLDTGDIGYIAGGELFVTSRAKDLIKRGGHNLHPYDLEAAVGELSGIRKGCVAVFGTTDKLAGTERVVVVAETRETAAPARARLAAEIQDLATVHLDGPADEIVLAAPQTLLKTSSGKLRRAACRELYEKGLLAAPRRAVWRQLAGLVASALCARVRRFARGVANAGFGLRSWVAFLVIAVCGVLALAFVPARHGPRFGRASARLFARLAGLAIRTEGSARLAARGALVLVGNHSSYLDAIALFASLPVDVHFAVKREFARVPLLGWAMRRVGSYFVERVDPARGVEDTRALEDAVKLGEYVAFFPEGGFARAPGLRAFGLGAFVVAAATGTSALPLAIRGTRSMLREGRWLPERGQIEIDLLDPVAPDGSDWSAAIRLRDRVRAAVLARCGEPDRVA